MGFGLFSGTMLNFLGLRSRFRFFGEVATLGGWSFRCDVLAVNLSNFCDVVMGDLGNGWESVFGFPNPKKS